MQSFARETDPTIEEPKAEPKYGNRKVLYDGICFDSEKERAYYVNLKLAERAGAIWDLQLQPRYTLQPSFKGPDGKTIRAIVYVADFEFREGVRENPTTVVVDTKGFSTKDFLLKEKMFRYLTRDEPNFEFRVEREDKPKKKKPRWKR